MIIKERVIFEKAKMNSQKGLWPHKAKPDWAETISTKRKKKTETQIALNKS